MLQFEAPKSLASFNHEHRNRESVFGELVHFHRERKLPHLGSVASCFDILFDLFFFKLKEEDFFILSKGHAVSLVYLLLRLKKKLPEDSWTSACLNGGHLPAHPPFYLSAENPWLPFGSGALGYGLGLAAGVALARRNKNLPGSVYVLLSDGDLNAGPCWEALQFVANQSLSNLIILYDDNDMQATGPKSEVLSSGALETFIRSLGFDLWQGDGHTSQDFPWYQASWDTKVRAPRFLWFKTQKNYRLHHLSNPLSAHYYDGS